MRWMAFGIALLAAAAVQTAAAQATLFTFNALLNGPSESPPNSSLGTGHALVTIDDTADTMSVHVDFTGLTGTTTASHIHCCTALPGVGTAGVATQTPTFTGFPLGVTSGTYDHIFDLLADATYNAPFRAAHGGTAAGAEAALLAGLLAGEVYLNVHSTFRTGGEIRGFLVPEPSSLMLLAAAFFGMIPLIRRRYSAPRT